MESSNKPQNHQKFLQNSEFFAFLKTHTGKGSKYPSFFSENGLDKDIIHVTGAEPDVCLEVFYALYHVLLPQIDKLNDLSFKDAWIRFIGGSISKGVLCPPEKLLAERRIKDLIQFFSEDNGEQQLFQELDQVMDSISHLKEKITEEMNSKEEIRASLDLAKGLYFRFRSQVKAYVQAIIEKREANVSFKSEIEALEDILEPKSIMLGDIFPYHWAYRISRIKAQQLLSLDMFGRKLKSNQSARPDKDHERLVFFKANGNTPIQPEREFIFYSLFRHLPMPIPQTAFLILTDVFETNPNYFYAVQASEAIRRKSHLKACQDLEINLEHKAYASQVMRAILTDQSLNNNYNEIYHTLMSLDNDLSEGYEKIIGAKSDLCLLKQIDLPVENSIKTFFKTLDPALTTSAWLLDLFEKNNEYNLLLKKIAFQNTRSLYQSLLPQSEVPSLTFCLEQKVFVDHELHGESFYPQILVSKKTVNSLTEKLQLVKSTLVHNPLLNPQCLFEEIFPGLADFIETCI